MPRVPIVEGQRLDATPLRGGYRDAPDANAALRSLAGGLMQSSDALQRVVDRENRSVALEAETNVKKEYLAFEADLRAKSRGRDAIGYAEKVENWWKEQAAKITGNLAPAQRDLIRQSLGAAQLQSMAAARSYQDGELERHDNETFTAAQLTEVQRAAASGDPAVAAVSSELLRKRNAERAAAKGWSPEQLAEANTRTTTALHVNLLQSLQQRDPAAAKRYFEANKGEIDGTRHAEIERTLNAAVASNEGDAAAGDIWRKMGPKTYNEPVALDKLEEAARTLYPNDEAKRRAALAGVKERAAAHNTAQNEANAAAINDVMGVYDRTRSLAAVKKSPAWSALPAQKRLDIETYITNQQTAILNRSIAQEGRELQRLQREQAMLQVKGYAQFLEYSDPQKLAGMSEAQVRALLPTLGNELTSHLLNQKRSLARNPVDLTEAKLDQDAFNDIAERLGLKPFDPKKSEDERAALGQLKFRAESIIALAQQDKGKKLTHQEKVDLMRQEMARTVTVGKSWWFDQERPVLLLTDAEVKDVIVPPTDKRQLVEAMGTMYARTGSSMYAPTEANLKRFYLQSKSPRAGSLIQPGQ